MNKLKNDDKQLSEYVVKYFSTVFIYYFYFIILAFFCQNLILFVSLT